MLALIEIVPPASTLPWRSPSAFGAAATKVPDTSSFACGPMWSGAVARLWPVSLTVIDPPGADTFASICTPPWPPRNVTCASAPC